MAAFDQTELIPHHYCARCGYDFRRASTIYLCPAVRKLDKCIHEIFGSGLIAGSPIENLVIRRLLGIPQFTGIHQQELLTGLSASFRARCFEHLVGHPNEGDIVTQRVRGVGRAFRSPVTKDGDNNVLIGLLSDGLAPKLGRPAADDSRPFVGLSHFLLTAQQMSRISMRPQSRRRDATAIVRCQC
ncbi:hypothetical protein [Rhizobium binxianense]